MELNDEQKKYFSYLQDKMIPAYQACGNDKVTTAATNLEWNAKKFLGEVPGETIDTAEYVRRTKHDFRLIEEFYPKDDEAKDFATEVLTRIDSFFGIEPEKAPEPVDIDAILAEKAAAHGEDLDWDTSIVDLLKLIGLDHSSSARKEYAAAMGFPPDKIASAPSAELNMWLHGQIMDAMAHNGGNVPEALKTAAA